MKISILQPQIIRGNIEHNVNAIQRLIDKSKGDLLVLAEYALTGSLVLDLEADVKNWVELSKNAKMKLNIPESKNLLLNSLIELDDKIYNACEILPSGGIQCKLFPDKPELESGVNAGDVHKNFKINNKSFKAIICTDLRYIKDISTDGLDFIFFVFHFTENNYNEAMKTAKSISIERNLPVIISSLISDKNIGFSSYINKDTVVSLPNLEGILEIEID